MKRKDISALHQKSDTELEKMLSEKQKELVKLMLEKKTKMPKNTQTFKTIRQDIARIKTIRNEHRLKEKKV